MAVTPYTVNSVVAGVSFGVHNLRNGSQIYIPPFHPLAFDPANLESNWNDIDIYDVDASTAQGFPVGTTLKIGGNVYEYFESGGTIARGLLAQREVADAVHSSFAAVAEDAGTKVISITSPASGSSDIVVGEYAGGKLAFELNGTPGYVYDILFNEACDISATTTMEVVLREGLATATVVGDDLSFYKHPAKQTIVHPSPNTAPLSGVPMESVTSGQFGWQCIHGDINILLDDASTLAAAGQHVRVSDEHDGYIEDLNRDGSNENEQSVGVLIADPGGGTGDNVYAMVAMDIGRGV